MDDVRRYFDVVFGIDYTVVARDPEHVIEILRIADHDYEDTHAYVGDPIITEILPGQASVRMIYDDNQLVPLTSLTLGEYASTEF